MVTVNECDYCSKPFDSDGFPSAIEVQSGRFHPECLEFLIEDGEVDKHEELG